MARDLDIKINVEADQAKRDLASVDKGIASVGTTAKTAATATDSLSTSMLKIAGGVNIANTFDRITSAAISYVKSIADLSDALVRMSDQTGIGIEALQILGAAAEDSGNSLDQITTAISMMQRKLAGGDAGAVAALNELHLSLVELKNLSPDRQFIEIADAIAKIQDPAERTRLAVEIFGRAGAAIL